MSCSRLTAHHIVLSQAFYTQQHHCLRVGGEGEDRLPPAGFFVVVLVVDSPSPPPTPRLLPDPGSFHFPACFHLFYPLLLLSPPPYPPLVAVSVGVLCCRRLPRFHNCPSISSLNSAQLFRSIHPDPTATSSLLPPTGVAAFYLQPFTMTINSYFYNFSPSKPQPAY